MLNIALLTVGSRGDVQPFAAIARGLQNAGHRVTLAAPSDSEALVVSHDIPFVSLGFDFQALVDSPQARGALAGRPRDLLHMIREGRTVTRSMIRVGGTVAADADVIVYHPKIMIGAQVAEATGASAFLAVPAPLVAPTRAFPVPVGVFPDFGPLNRMTYALFRLGMMPYHRLINAWRADALGLQPRGRLADPFSLGGKPIPTLYAFSELIVSRPPDWPGHVHVTGYWNLDEANSAYEPSRDLVRFLESGAPPVYVGFGSMVGRDPERTTRIVLEAVRRTGVRAVLARGWGGLCTGEVGPGVYIVDSAPHEWLFPQCAAIVHHGGSGTTAAALRAGRSSVICPFFADQAFWGQRVHTLGAGPEPIPHKKLTSDRLAAAIQTAVEDEGMSKRAGEIRDGLSSEDGVSRAVSLIGRATPTACRAHNKSLQRTRLPARR